MRRLPVYFVIDVSESMVGDPIAKVEEGMRTIISELKKDPYALETVFVSVIAFAGKAKTVVPLTDIISFYPPQIPLGAGTAYGVALRHLMHEIETNVVKTTYERKGDWKPIIFFLTDGNPTDDYRIDLGVWATKWRDKSNIVVISIGDNVDPAILKNISNTVLAIDDADAESYKEFFRWVTGSIKNQSQKIETGQGDGALNTSGIDVTKVKQVDVNIPDPKRDHDDQYAIFNARCQQTQRDYLVKYKKGKVDAHMPGMGHYILEKYKLVGSYTLNEGYGELSTEDSRQSRSQVSTEELWGMPNCPNCSNRIGMCICQCGGVFCVDNAGMQTCPHCKQTSQFGQGDGHIDLDRQQG